MRWRVVESNFLPSHEDCLGLMSTSQPNLPHKMVLRINQKMSNDHCGKLLQETKDGVCGKETNEMVILLALIYLVSNPRTTAPIDLAAPADANPATPPPMIRTCCPHNVLQLNHMHTHQFNCFTGNVCWLAEEANFKLSTAESSSHTIFHINCTL